MSAAYLAFPVTFCEESRAAYDRVGLTSFFAHRDAEKLMIVGVEQITPMHFHWNKAEDIINRGGGKLHPHAEVAVMVREAIVIIEGETTTDQEEVHVNTLIENDVVAGEAAEEVAEVDDFLLPLLDFHVATKKRMENVLSI